jgi:hypothetical protein
MTTTPERSQERRIPVPNGRRTRGVAVLFVVLVVGGLLAVGWRRGAEASFATPEECLEAFRDAGRDGDTTTFVRCLGPDLREQSDRLFAETNRDLRAVQHWNQYRAEKVEGMAKILVDQVRRDGMIQRVSYRLARSGAGWQVVEIGKPQLFTPPVRPGTHINDTVAPPSDE